MGRMAAEGMAAAVAEGFGSLRLAVSWHLQSNHYPPVPSFMVEPALAAIEAGNDGGDFDRIIELPKGCSTCRAELNEDGTHKMRLDVLTLTAVSDAYDHDPVPEAMVEWRDGRTAIEAHLIIESFHLDSFIDYDEDDL